MSFIFVRHLKTGGKPFQQRFLHSSLEQTLSSASVVKRVGYSNVFRRKRCPSCYFWRSVSEQRPFGFSTMASTCVTQTVASAAANDATGDTASQLKTLHLHPAPEERTMYRKDYRPPLYTVKHITLNFDLGVSATTVTTDLYMSRVTSGESSVDLVLDGEDLTLLDVSLTRSDSDPDALLQGKTNFGLIDLSNRLSAERQEYRVLDTPANMKGKLWISGSVLPSAPHVLFKLTTRVTVHPELNLKLSGLYKSGTLLCTQCEAEGFRRITYALDRPDVLSTFCVRLEADAEEFPVLLSNGNQKEKGAAESFDSVHKHVSETSNTQEFEQNKNAVLLPSAKIPRKEGTKRHFAVFDDPFPKPCYLFALVAGKLACQEDVFHNGEKGDTRLSLWCEPQEKERLGWAMESLKAAMQWDIDTYGLYYDLNWFNIVAVPNFNFGAMENKSLNIFNSALLLCSPETSTDNDFVTVRSVVGHEYFHNWTGNRVTCRDWFQLTLKEGLTVYREQEFHASQWSRSVSRIHDVQQLRSAQFPEDSGPLAHPVRPDSYIAIDNFYTATVYEKGAEIIRMYETLLGTENFKKGLALYLQRHDGQAATCGDFRRAMIDANQCTRLEAMAHWYSTAGTPVVSVTNALYDPAQRRFSFTLTQTSPKNTALLLPIRVGLIGRTSKKDLLAPSPVLELCSLEPQHYAFDDIEEDCVLSVLRGFSAPVRLDYPFSDATLSFILAHDTDAFNRWEAGQILTSRVIQEYTNEIMKQLKELSSEENRLCVAVEPLPAALVEAYKKILASPHDDLAFQSLLLSLPTEATLVDSMPAPCNPVAVSLARAFVKFSLAQHLYDNFDAVYRRLSAEKKSYSVTYSDIGVRSLRNLCLSYLTSRNPFSADKAAALKLQNKAYTHYVEANNMTDRMGAMCCLKDMEGELRTKALDLFYTSGEGNDAIMTAWFALCASSDVSTTLETVKSLRSHPAFKSTNANYLRSLIGAFGRNTLHFHRADGLGYALYADAILDIDTFNSQVAARLASKFSNWRKFDQARQEMIKTQLRRILNAPNVSKDCYEICTKAL